MILADQDGGTMPDLSEADILALAKAVNLTIPRELLSEVAINLNTLLDALDRINVPGLDKVEPLPIIIPPG